MAENNHTPLSLFQANPFLSLVELQEWARHLGITWEDFENKWNYHSTMGRHGTAARAAKREVDALPENEKQDAINEYIESSGYIRLEDLDVMDGVQTDSVAHVQGREDEDAVVGDTTRLGSALSTGYRHARNVSYSDASGNFVPDTSVASGSRPVPPRSSFRGSAVMFYATYYPEQFQAHLYEQDVLDRAARRLAGKRMPNPNRKN